MTIEDMRAKTAKLILIAIALYMPANSAYAIDNIQAKAFAGRDVQIAADKLTNYHDAGGRAGAQHRMGRFDKR